MSEWAFTLACCCCPVGFDAYAWQGIKDCICEHPIENLKDDISRIEDCKTVFCGPGNVCGGAMQFEPDQYDAIKEWVEKGGRLWCNGEYNSEEEFGYDCLGDEAREKINSFMSALGCSMQVGHHACNCGCVDPDGEPWLGINGSAKIVTTPDALPGVYHACVGEVTGGTPINLTQPVQDYSGGSSEACLSSYPWIAIQKVGKGVVVLTGDSNVFDGCGHDNCEIAKRFIKNEPEDLI